MQIELILVPFDVEREDSGLARSPIELQSRGLADRLLADDVSLWTRVVGSRHHDDAAVKVSGVARAISRRVGRASSRRRYPLVISGGCLSAVGVTVGLQRTGRAFTTLWFDAHGDFNTPETTPSGYWDGMALAAVCGRSLSPIFEAVELSPMPFRRIVHLGGRALDASETEDFARLKVLTLGPSELSSRWGEVGARLHPYADYYLHIDLDVLDPVDAPALQLPVPGGLRLAELEQCIRSLGRPPLAMTLSGMNFEGVTPEEAERQLEVCLRLISAALAHAGSERSAHAAAS